MKRPTKDSLVYTLVLAIGYILGCSSTVNRSSIGNLQRKPAPQRMLYSTVRSTAVFPTNTGIQPVLASIFGVGFRAHPNVAIANPSDLGQSFELNCGWYPVSGIHATNGNSGLLPMLDANLYVGTSGTAGCGNATPITSVGADENGSPTGFPIFQSGTINSLVVWGVFLSGNRFRCLDTSNIFALQDGTFVRPYYDLAHDTVILGSGTTQLSLACPISIPAGDDVGAIVVQWVKS